MYPSKLISTEEKVALIKSDICGDCTLVSRVDSSVELTTFTGELNVWAALDWNKINGKSLNILFCHDDNHRSKNLTHFEDVKYEIIGENRKELTQTIFKSNSQKAKIEDIKFKFDESTKVVGFKKKDLEEITDKYEKWPKGKQKPSVEYIFKIEILHDPTLVNAFHFEVNLLGREDKKKPEEFTRITKNVFSKKKDTKGNYIVRDFFKPIVSRITNQFSINEHLFILESTRF